MAPSSTCSPDAGKVWIHILQGIELTTHVLKISQVPVVDEVLFEEILFEEFCKQQMKRLEEMEPTEESIVFSYMWKLNDNLKTLFDLEGFSDKITRGENITVLHNAMDAIEQEP
jgi:hypothetical protein